MVKLKSLNEQQREAVLAVDGPVAVIAGAGTGKTRTIVYRTATLLERGIPPENILAITFTNKAAREMRERISKMCGADIARRMTLSTIHSLCSRILREDIREIGRGERFTIFDAGDQAGLVRKALTTHGFDPQKNDPRALLWRISSVKQIFPPVEADDFADPVLKMVFKTYNELLLDNNGMDFDDLLQFAARLLSKKNIAKKYQDRFRYVMVDEFQDINDIQYQIVKSLAGEKPNLYVVGDDDQSIYGWRGAVVDNILEFEHDFKGAKVIKLEQNYRSTANILEAAHAVIRNNEKRRDKKVWTNGEPGEALALYVCDDDRQEAEMVVDFIAGERESRRGKYGDFAILYRTNAQSRPFEERLVHLGISYIMVGGTRFFERKEIKDMTSYLRVLHNPEDDVALLRVINFPARGIGQRTMEKIQETALAKKQPLYPSLRDAAGDASLPKKAREGISQFLTVAARAEELLSKNRLTDTAKFLVKELDIKGTYERTITDRNEARRRFENVEEWVNAIAEYETNGQAPSLEGFLENVALMTEEKEEEIELKDDSVTLMTIHSAKGLEFNTVYIVGAEEKLIPHERSITDNTVDEERRLFYVAMTRARKNLCITLAAERKRFGETLMRAPSRFVGEIPDELTTSESPEEIALRREQAAARLRESNMDYLRKMMEDD